MTQLKTSRLIPAPAEEVFAAFSQPERLARWWGPTGFTNTFSLCEFKEGGRWTYLMHGPEGRNYPNESVFKEIKPMRRLIIEHVSKPKYRLTVGLDSSAAGTVVSWSQEFENVKFEDRMRQFLLTANEQNLDRLSAEVLREPYRD